MSKLTESRFFEDIYVTDVRVISGIRPNGRAVDKTTVGRATNGLLFIWNGETTFREKSRVTVAGHGDLVFIPMGAKYKMEYTAESTTFVLVDFATYTRGGEVALLHDSIKILAKDGADNGIARIMTSFELCSSSKNTAAIFRRRELLYRLLGLVNGASFQNETEKGGNTRIVDGILLLEKTYLENIPISELARACHVSENTFRSLFRKQYKTSPIQYRNLLRIARARELLSEGSCTVTEAAYGSGFENVGYFCRLYKKLTGENPSRAKKKTGE